MITLVRRSLRAHRARLGLTLLAVTLSVSFVTAGFVLADSLRAAFGDISAEIYDGVDAELRAAEGDFDRTETGARFSDTVVDDLLDVEGVAEAVPVLEGRDTLFAVDDDGEVLRPQGPPVLAFSSAGDSSASPFRTVAGRSPGPGEIALDRAQADVLGLELGDDVHVAAPSGSERFELVGTVTFGDVESGLDPYFLLFDLPTIQRLLDADGTVDAVSIVVDDGADVGEVVDRLRTAAPDLAVADGAQLVDEQEAEFGEVIDLVQVALLVFAGITLFVSTFVIANTFAVLVGQQRRQLGLLRAVGATSRRASTLVVGEATLVGLVAAVLGVGGGVLVAGGITALFDAVSDGGFPETSLRMEPRTIVVALAVGVGVTTVAAALPASRAGRTSPLQAMRAETVRGDAGNGRGSGLVALFARVIVGRLGTAGRLAAGNVARTPRRTLATAMSMIVGLGLISAMTVFAASYRSTIGDVTSSSYDGDLVVAGDDGVAVPFAALDGLADHPAVEVASAFGSTEVRSAGEILPVTSLQPGSASEVLELDVVDGAIDQVDGARGAVSAELAERRSIGVGDTVPVEFSDGVVVDVNVVAVAEPPTAIDGDLLLDAELVADHARSVEADLGVVRLADGVEPAAGRATVTRLLEGHPQLSVETMAEHVAAREAQAEQLLALANGLLALTVVVALTGIANTVALTVMERRRELGLLRAVGMSRRQVRRMVRHEALVVSSLGALVGLGIGVGLAAATIPLLPDALVGVVEVPVGPLVVSTAVAVLFGVLAAVWPARRAGRLDVLEALRATD